MENIELFMSIAILISVVVGLLFFVVMYLLLTQKNTVDKYYTKSYFLISKNLSNEIMKLKRKLQ